MGSQTFHVNSRGKSAKEAYDRAVEEANDECGHQHGYSGAINATPGFKDVTSVYQSSKKDINKYISERLEVLSKHNGAECICIREPKLNNNKIKSQVEHVVEKGTKKWVLKYVVYQGWTEDKRVAAFDTKGDAVKKAREITEKTQDSTCVKMEKVLEKGSIKVAKVTYKRSTNESDGEYVFYGWASC